MRQYELKFINTQPIDDPFVVLDLLVEGWNDRSNRHIDRTPMWPPHVVVSYFGGHYDRLTSRDRFLITTDVVERLLADRLIEGTPDWGYTNMRELIPTQRGVDLLWDARIRLGSDFPRAAIWFEVLK